MGKILPITIIILIINIINTCDSQRAKDVMYEPIHGFSACFRRMNGTHQTGCTSDMEGSTGVVHFIEQKSDLDTILNADNTLTYIPVMPIGLFIKSIVEALQKSEKISGLIVYEKNETLAYFSHEKVCPNEGSNLEGTCGGEQKWNEHGTGLLYEDFKFPIFYVKDSVDVEKIQNCFNKFNSFDFTTQSERSLCSLQISGFMFGAIDTPTCMRRGEYLKNLNPVKVCDPMGDLNVWGSLFPMGNSSVNPNVTIKSHIKHIILTARLDTTSMFNDYAPGAINPISGLVTLLSTAQLLKKMLPNYENYETNVIFLLLHGETYDYIGSQRIVYDIQQNEFPTKSFKNDKESLSHINSEDILFVIELNQLSLSNQLFIHNTDDQSEFINKLKIYNQGIKINEVASGLIPPSSLQTFLKANISGLVITNHASQYTNQFYNSMYDNSNNFKYKYLNKTYDDNTIDTIQAFIANVTTMLAKSLYEEITHNSYEGTEKSDIRIVDELLHCYLDTANCTIHQAIQRIPFRDSTLSLYVGVTISQNYLTKLIGLTLAWFTGDLIETNGGDCYKNMTSDVYHYLNMSANIDQLNVTKCFRSSINFTEALSPAFLIEDYDFKSGQYSSWTESVWKGFSLRIFLKPSRAHEGMTMAVGTIVFVFSTFIVAFISKKASTLFETDISPTNC